MLKAYNGMEALEQAVNPALRLIVIDVMMPKLDGLSAVMKIREKRNLPIIVLSAQERGLGQGARPVHGGRTTTSPSPSIPRSWWPGCVASSGAIPNWAT